MDKFYCFRCAPLYPHVNLEVCPEHGHLRVVIKPCPRCSVEHDQRLTCEETAEAFMALRNMLKGAGVTVRDDPDFEEVS